MLLSHYRSPTVWQSNDILPNIVPWNMPERDRLAALHSIHVSLLNPRQDNLITAHLARVHATGRRSQVLDVGTGTGAWGVTVAMHHPYADVLGVDNKWSHFSPAGRLPHGNMAFETVDVTKCLPWPANTFDLIHVKSMLMDIPHYPDLIRRLAHTLRPGGLLILVENDLSYESARGPPSFAVTNWFDSLRSVLAAKNIDVDLPKKLDSTIAATGLFSPQFFFQEIGCPVGPYMGGDTTLFRAGQIQATVVRATLWRLVSNGLEPGPRRKALELLTQACGEELCADEARYLQRLFAVYAYKKSTVR